MRTDNYSLDVCLECCDYRKCCRDCGRCASCSRHAACVYVVPDDETPDDIKKRHDAEAFSDDGA